ncbi:adenosylcobinamide-GDP ribazoletransferase [Acetobacter persici]|uniref:adenosylcobinamide-GDP ribazoletransferase n=1 Tax=Acetobacter persici TaxID=1076596 RepID=UPI0020CDA703|nr:adenosylcobinamide-GDP ribazoletransferase [Acetobacter persici]MCP9318978.1 adenosylcobinamide-GDP ribazoletransferase [Acetobacter persici]
MKPAPAESCVDRVRLDVACGLSLLTRLPVNWLLSPAQRASTALWPMGRSIWCWPLIGAGLGGLVGMLFWLLRLSHMAALPAAGLALAFQCVLTGGLHEDGLADMADGCGGATRERRLEIMRDSRTGSYGVLALCLSLLVRASAVAALPPSMAVLALAVSGCLARVALLVLAACLPPARPDGLARSLSPLPRGPLWLGLFLAVGCVLGMLWEMIFSSAETVDGGGIRTQGASLATSGGELGLDSLLVPESLTLLHLELVVAGAALMACMLVGGAARRMLGGYTGDVLGAAAVVTECCVLSALTAVF